MLRISGVFHNWNMPCGMGDSGTTMGDWEPWARMAALSQANPPPN